MAISQARLTRIDLGAIPSAASGSSIGLSDVLATAELVFCSRAVEEWAARGKEGEVRRGEGDQPHARSSCSAGPSLSTGTAYLRGLEGDERLVHSRRVGHLSSCGRPVWGKGAKSRAIARAGRGGRRREGGRAGQPPSRRHHRTTEADANRRARTDLAAAEGIFQGRLMSGDWGRRGSVGEG